MLFGAWRFKSSSGHHYSKKQMFSLFFSISTDLIAMNEWRYAKKNEVQHESGFVLQLLAGDWSDPSDLSPCSPKNMSVSDAARLLREGLVYAQTNPFPSPDSTISSKQESTKPKRKYGPRTLSLRKKNQVDA